MTHGVKTLRVVQGREPAATYGRESVVLVDEDGNPFEGGGGERGPEGPRGPEGQQGPAGADGADGFGTEAQYNDIIARLEALENAGD